MVDIRLKEIANRRTELIIARIGKKKLVRNNWVLSVGKEQSDAREKRTNDGDNAQETVKTVVMEEITWRMISKRRNRKYDKEGKKRPIKLTCRQE